MTEAYVDSYLQMRVFLSRDDLKSLEVNKKLIGKLLRISQDMPSAEYPIGIYLCDHDRPSDNELNPKYNPKSQFEIYISRRRLELIKRGKFTDAESPRKWLRQICVSLEGVL